MLPNVQPRASLRGSILNICNTILGAGMLAMPSAIASVGLVFGLVLILLSGLCAAFGLWLLTHTATHTPPRSASFFAVSALTYPRAGIYFDTAIAIKCFGVATSYLIVIADLMPEVVLGFGGNASSVFATRRFWLLISMLIIVPLSFTKRLDQLRHTSFVALLAVVYLVAIVIYFFIYPDFPIVPGEVKLFCFNLGFFKTLPIFVFAFTCHQNIFSVYNEIKNNSQTNLNIVTSVSISTALMVYMTIGSLGYLMYGDNVSSNIIHMYPVIPAVTGGRLALALLMTFSFPIQAHPCRESFNKIINHLYGVISHSTNQLSTTDQRSPLLPHSTSCLSVEQDDPHALDPSSSIPQIGGGLVKRTQLGKSSYFSDTLTVDSEGHSRVSSSANVWMQSSSQQQQPSFIRHIAMTTTILILSFTIAFFVRSLDRVLAVVGATGSTTICYILPGLFYYKLHQGQPWIVTRIAAVCLSVTGIFIMVCCLIVQTALV